MRLVDMLLVRQAVAALDPAAFLQYALKVEKRTDMKSVKQEHRVSSWRQTQLAAQRSATRMYAYVPARCRRLVNGHASCRS